MGKSKPSTFRMIAEFALTVGVYWYMTRPPGEPPLPAVVWRRTAIVAQAAAHRLGQLGIVAERNYYREVGK